jgi:uncharacterized protein YegL
MKYDTELVFILDRSGSMRGFEKDTIGGYNEMIDKQKKIDLPCVVSTVLFDDQFEVLHNRVDLKDIKELTLNDYFVRGSTALLDAIGRSIQKISTIHRKFDQIDKPEKVLFVIITDGMENSSREYNYSSIKRMIELEKNEFGWEFIFIGANMDAIMVAEQMGIHPSRSAKYTPDMLGTKLNYEVIDETIAEFRSNNMIRDDWKDKIDKNYKKSKNSK